MEPKVICLDLARPLEEVEKIFIRAVLEKNKGNVTHTAKSLQIGARTLQRMRIRWRAEEDHGEENSI